ncbi:ATP-binding protein [Faecalicatena orotica]|uniref:ATP-binding protein n=1 Tax=Faecalicatena orotica TaxID=1544 RepID=UPI0032175E30
MMAFWDKISYMVQILTACIIFAVPARRRSHFAVRAWGSAVALVACSYFVNLYYGVPENGAFPFTYWAFYIVVCIMFAKFVLDATWQQAAYCAVCGCGMQHIAFDIYLIYQISGGESGLISLLIYVVIYLLFYQFFAKKLPEKGEFAASRQALFPIATIILLVWILSILDNSAIAGFEAGMWHRIIYRVIDGLCCFYVLWVQINQKEKMSLQRELDGINSAWRQQKKQYQVTSETIESINRKCHDLKHQIRALREITDEKEKEEYFNEIENDIMIYDTALNTGNKALDTVMMEKGLFCKNHGIQWSCMADGTKLDFMKLEDIYAIFGNALDNAIAAVLDLKEPEKRVISVKIINQNSLLMIQIQNYYENKLHFEGGLPVTTKKNKRDHGYGMKSIRYTAEKYNGTITVNGEGNIFMLQILIPVQRPSA